MIYKKKTYFECVIPEQNKRAFYELSAGRDLFGFMLVRRWGRIGCKGRRQRQRFLDENDMLKAYKRIHKERIKHKYIAVSRNK